MAQMRRSMFLSIIKFRCFTAIASSSTSPFICRKGGTDFRVAGMTLLEVLVAMSMLVVFTAVVVMVTEFTNQFFVDAEGGFKGGLVEQVEIQIDMDRLVGVLSQSGGVSYSHARQISNTYSSTPSSTCVGPGGDIAEVWNLPIPSTSLTSAGYSLCLWSTLPAETRSSPGIYVLQALPETVSATRFPVRRIFCRPRYLC